MCVLAPGRVCATFGSSGIQHTHTVLTSITVVTVCFFPHEVHILLSVLICMTHRWETIFMLVIFMLIACFEGC